MRGLLWAAMALMCGVTTSHRHALQLRGQILPHSPQIPASLPANSSARVTHAAPPANVTNANASATAAPRIPTVNTTAAANASAAADDTQYPRLRSFRQQAVRQLAIVLATFDDKKSVEQLDPFEYLGAIFVVALGVGGTAWCVLLPRSSLRAHPLGRGPQNKHHACPLRNLQCIGKRTADLCVACVRSQDHLRDRLDHLRPRARGARPGPQVRLPRGADEILMRRHMRLYTV